MPFRWKISKREQLGALIQGPAVEPDPSLLEALRPCCAKVVAFAGDSDLVFIGRSPENLFDYLSGLYHGTPRSDRLTLLHLSIRFQDPRQLAGTTPNELAALHRYFKRMKLDPGSLIGRERPVAFIDFVATGSTFGALTGMLHFWSEERRLDWNAVQRKLRIVGITERTKTSPKTWRWQQHQDWLDVAPHLTIKNVSAPAWFCHHLMARQDKVTPSHRADQWRKSETAPPPREAENLEALRLAVALFDTGQSKQERERFVAELTRQREKRAAWFRRLVTDLRH